MEQRIVRMERTSEQSTRRTKDVQERANRDVVAGAERVERSRATVEERSEREREARRRRSSEMAGRYAAQTAREEERAAQQATRAIEREEERKMRIRIRSSEMAGRLAAQEAAAEIRAAENAAAARGRLGTRIASNMGNRISGMASMVGGAAGIGGGFFLVDQARQLSQAQQTAALLVNATTAGGVPQPGATVSNIMGRASQVSRETGVARNDVIQAALTYSRGARGGDITGALGNMSFFTKLSMVTGADINDIAGAAGKLQSQNPALGGKNNEAMQQMLLNAYAQSKAGSVSMTEAVKQIGTLGSTRGLYQGDEATNQRKLLALGQIAASGGNVEDIGTYIKDVSMEAAAHMGKGGKAAQFLKGVKTDKYGRFESPEQLIEQVFRNTGGNLGKIHEVFGNRGIPLFTELQGSYTRAGGGEKGIRAVHEQIAGVTGATGTPQDLEKQFQNVVTEPGKRLEIAFNRLGEVTKSQLAPVLEHLADKLPELIPAIDKAIQGVLWFADFMIKNPLAGIGGIIGAAVAKDVAAAGIGALIKALLSGGAGIGGAGATAVNVGSKAAGGFLGAMGAVGAGAILGAGAQVAITRSEIGDLTAHQNAGAMGVARAGATAANLSRAARTGTVTPAQIAAAQAQASALSAQTAQQGANVGVNPMGIAQTAVAYAMGHGGEIRKQQTKEQTRAYQMSKLALEQLNSAIVLSAAALRDHATASRSQPMPARGQGGH